ncbi:MAG: sensor histidine kinase [Taibaiella sp.]|nr:sensor histidine kinase [Taibaiella sp.]
MRSVKYLLFLLTLLFTVYNSGIAQSIGDKITSFTGNEGQQLIGDKMYVFVDSTGSMPFNDVLAKNEFKPAASKIPNLGVTPYHCWFRLNIQNNSSLPDFVLQIENPLLEKVVLFKPDSGRYISFPISKELPFDSRSNKSQNYEFLIRQHPGSVATYYFEIVSNTLLLVPVKIGSQISTSDSDLNKDLLTAIYFGIMLVMILYNLFVYFSIKDKSYLYYIFYIITVSLVQLNITGFGFKYLWPSFSHFERYSVYLFPSLTAFASIAFIRQFLLTKQYVPVMHKGFWIFVVSYVFLLLNALWGNKLLSYNMLNLNALPLSLYMIGTSAYIKVKYKYRPASFFLIAWIVFLIGIIFFVLKDFGVIPYNLFTVSAIQIGSAVEVILLSIALADRINILKAEKEESQERTLAALEENARIVSEQNVMLENKVNERTIELQESNQELNKTLVDLKEAEMQLVESEKMASLGQLTAGIAHEINNPINFVTSNVNPLKRDVAILLETIVTMETVGLSDVPHAEKVKQIQEYKEEIDFDYLKVEIEHLLKGINEGATRTAEIVKGLRIFSRLDEDDLKKADINEGIDSTLVIVNNLLGNSIKLVKNYGNLPLIECYPGKLNQVFLNIISNAIHAINKLHETDNKGLLTISTSADENNVYVKFEDNGTGMDDATMKKIFEPFFTTKEVGEGTGLGMSIAYNTINKHNGQIHIKSVVNEGTEFTLELPIIHQINEVQP